MWEMTPAALEAAKKRFNSLSASFEGAEAILYEKPSRILHVRLSQLAIDDWGVKCQLDVIPTPGIEEFSRATFPFENSWTILSFAAGWWHMSSIPGANWAMYFEPQVVREILEICAAAARNNSTIIYRDIVKCVHAFDDRLHAAYKESWERSKRARALNNT